jgi:hypothetical protein
MRRLVAPLLRILGTNWLTLFGTSVTTVSAIAMIGFFLLGLVGLANSPYIALMALLVLPAIFVIGLLLIPLGIWIHRRRAKEVEEGKRPAAPEFPIIDFNKTTVRRVTGSVVGLTIVNLLIISLASYEGVHYMDSTRFCGQVCHTVMQPEYTAYRHSPHSRVACVDCHIGPGAPWFVRSKLSGLGQVYAVTFNTYERPIPSPVQNLRPSQEICENCHWPERFTGDRVDVIDKYQEDEANTPVRTVLLLHIGGGNRGTGIHSWHIKPGRQTYYYPSDERRQVIPWVQVREGDHVIDFAAEGFDPSTMDPTKIRKMDCIDCHNRPTHIFKMPGPAMDAALSDGRIDTSIPFIRKVGAEVLTEVGKTLGPAGDVSAKILEYYEKNQADYLKEHRETVESAAQAIGVIYSRNVFPKMDLGWGYYPVNIGHHGDDFEGGCFRCHDGSHTSSNGKTITSDCDTCHTLLAQDEENPKILTELGIQ